MLFIDKDDFFEIYFNSMLASYDRDTIALLYQPIIGNDAMALYFTLWSYSKLRSSFELFNHQLILSSLGMNTSSLQEARCKLEAVGLIQTYYKKENDRAFYIYCLYAPKSPSDFFKDALFSRLLKERIGEKNAQKLSNIYKNKPLDINNYSEISSTFPEVFSEDINKIDTLDSIDIDSSTYGRKQKDISEGFDSGLFAKTLEEIYQISSKVITKSMIKEIASLSLFYGVNEEDMASYFSQSFNGRNVKHKLDLVKIEELCKSDKNYSKIRRKSNGVNPLDINSPLGSEIRKYTTLSTMDYLSYKQGGTTPAPSDIYVVNKLSKMGIVPEVVNVIVDYTLKNCNNVLQSNYATKIAGSIARENITDVTDAMNYLEKIRNRPYSKKNTYKKTDDTVEKEEEQQSVVTDKDVEDFLKSLD